MTLCLDTNVVVWLLLGDRGAVSVRAQAALASADRVLVSAASVWEIAIKRSLGKLRIADGWHEALWRLDVEQLAVTSRHAATVETLPWHHHDPFDRLLVAQAMTEDCPLVTADDRLTAYPVDVLW